MYTYTHGVGNVHKRRQPVVTQSAKRKLQLLLWASVCLVFTTMFVYQAVASDQSDTDYVLVQVSKGDSLWSVTKNHYAGDRDIREVIYEVKKINSLTTSTITPRQWIKIPIK